MSIPSVGGGHQLNEDTQWGVSFDYYYRKSSNLYSGTSRVENPASAETLFQRSELGLHYRLRESEMLLSLTLPYTDAWFNEGGAPRNSIEGLGDIRFVASWYPWLSRDNEFLKSWGLSFGIIFPTGKDAPQALVGTAVPTVLQLGTGTYQLIAGFTHTLKFSNWYVETQAQLTFPLGDNHSGYKPAPLWSGSVSLEHALTKRFDFRFACLLSHAQEDTLSGVEITNTGSTVIELQPEILWELSDLISANASVAIPVYRNVRSTQIGVGSRFNIGLNFRF